MGVTKRQRVISRLAQGLEIFENSPDLGAYFRPIESHQQKKGDAHASRTKKRQRRYLNHWRMATGDAVAQSFDKHPPKGVLDGSHRPAHALFLCGNRPSTAAHSWSPWRLFLLAFCDAGTGP